MQAERVRDEAAFLKDQLRQRLSEPASLLAGDINAAPTMGDVLFSAQVRFAEADGFFLDPVVVDYRRQYNLFGDPSLRLVK